MALEDILAAIRADTDAHIADILADADRKADELTERSSVATDAAVTRIITAADMEAREEAERMVVAARAAVTERITAAVESVYQETLDALRSELARLRSTPRYHSVFSALASEAHDRIGDMTEIRVDPSDETLAAEFAERISTGGAAPAVISTLTTAGGVVVAEGNRRAVDNTLESRLLAADGLLRAVWARNVLGEEPIT